MAVILSKPRDLILRIDADSFVRLNPNGKGAFEHPVSEGSYPRSGLSHPILAIGDYIMFTIVDNVIVNNAAGHFVVTGIDLVRDSANQGLWSWQVSFERKKGDLSGL